MQTTLLFGFSFFCVITGKNRIFFLYKMLESCVTFCVSLVFGGRGGKMAPELDDLKPDVGGDRLPEWLEDTLTHRSQLSVSGSFLLFTSQTVGVWGNTSLVFWHRLPLLTLGLRTFLNVSGFMLTFFHLRVKHVTWFPLSQRPLALITDSFSCREASARHENQNKRPENNGDVWQEFPRRRVSPLFLKIVLHRWSFLEGEVFLCRFYETLWTPGAKRSSLKANGVFVLRSDGNISSCETLSCFLGLLQQRQCNSRWSDKKAFCLRSVLTSLSRLLR